jgi:hypothetical protein
MALMKDEGENANLGICSKGLVTDRAEV